MTFQVGDRVVRVQPSEVPSSFGEVGVEYEVLSATASRIRVMSGKPYAMSSCFKLVGQKPKLKGYAKWVSKVEGKLDE